MVHSVPKKYVTTVQNRWVNTFFGDMATLYRDAKLTALKFLLTNDLGKSHINTQLQQRFGLNKRQANSIIAYTTGEIKSARECRILHIEQLQGKLKHTQDVINALEQKVQQHQEYLRTVDRLQRGEIKDL